MVHKVHVHLKKWVKTVSQELLPQFESSKAQIEKAMESKKIYRQKVNRRGVAINEQHFWSERLSTLTGEFVRIYLHDGVADIFTDRSSLVDSFKIGF